ncbi:5'-3' exoribonuclease, partial [Aspergillus sclerotialis]
MGGYINEHGVINLERLGMLIEAFSDVEFRFFEVEYSDARWIHAKKKGADGDPEPQEMRKGFTVTPDQKKIFQSVRKYVLNRPEKAAGVKPLDLPSTLPARDR